MSSVLQLVEKIGLSSEWCYADSIHTAQWVSGAEKALVDAVHSGRNVQVKALFRGGRHLLCHLFPAGRPDNEEPAEHEDGRETSKQKKVS